MASSMDHDFVDDLPEDCQCPICTNVLTSPVLIECCGQSFCEACLENWLRRKKTCLHCRDTKLKYIKDLRMQRIINGLRIYCPNQSVGCDEIFAISEQKEHLTKCFFVEVSCTNKCGETILRKYLKHHFQIKCLNRRVKCKHCKKQDTYKNFKTSHIQSCPQLPLVCPNKCGLANILRKDMPAHRDTCTHEHVKCPFSKVGCKDVLLRKDLEAHRTSNTQKHLEMVLETQDQLEKQLDESKHRSNKLLLVAIELEKQKQESTQLALKAQKQLEEQLIEVRHESKQLALQSSKAQEQLEKQLIEMRHESKQLALKASKTQEQLEKQLGDVKHESKQLALKFDGLSFCVSKQIHSIKQYAARTPEAIDNIATMLESTATMPTMLEPDDKLYSLPIARVSNCDGRSASFFIKPGYEIYITINYADYCEVWLEHGENDDKLNWPMPGIEIQLFSKEGRPISDHIVICSLCVHGVTVESTETERRIHPKDGGDKPVAYMTVTIREMIFVQLSNHNCPNILL